MQQAYRAGEARADAPAAPIESYVAEKAANDPRREPLAGYHAAVADGLRSMSPAVGDRMVALLVAGTDFALVAGGTFLAGLLYHVLAMGTVGGVALYGGFAVLIAATFAGIMLGSDRYQIVGLYQEQRMLRDVLTRYAIAFSIVVSLMFLAKIADTYSRATLVLQFAVGAVGLVIVRHFIHRLLRWATKFGLVRARRVALVGSEAAVVGFAQNFQPWNDGIWVVATSYLSNAMVANGRGGEALAPAVAERLAADLRKAAPDDVILVLPWDAEGLIRDITFTLSSLPAAVHLAPERMISWIQEPNFTTVGAATTLTVIRQPLSTSEQIFKRVMDVAASSVALVLLAPVLILAALAIKLQDGGPIFYRQARHGFNEDTFEIFKFRTMTVDASSGGFVQATAKDARITKVGALLRRTNIDELPQLLNVLRGEMSLVGPRPHAVDHNREFEARIALYARRHNVKPGITGWAQVNGYRGPTDTLEKMDGRIEHDLYYIDNWSPLLDFRILLLTVFSRKAYRNAH
jgi:Undecaprenyl-phosphate glucose phosphotransferase